jgi:hypothetical protein
MGEEMKRAGDRRGWVAIVLVSGVADVVGAVRGSERLHWTQQAARGEAERWATEMGLGQLIWESLDEEMAIGRAPGHVALVRSFLLPLGSPEEETQSRADGATTRRTFH